MNTLRLELQRFPIFLDLHSGLQILHHQFWNHIFDISRSAIWTKNSPSAILEFFNFLTFLDLQSELTNFHGISRKLKHLSTFSSMREEIHEQEVNLNNLLSLLCSRKPRDANSRQRDKGSLNSSTQAKPSPARGAA